MVEAYRAKEKKGRGRGGEEEGDEDNQEDGAPRPKRVPPTSAYVRFVWQACPPLPLPIAVFD